MRLAFRIAALFLIAALSALASCGGQHFSTATNDDSLSAAWPGHGWDGGARSGAFVAVAVDSTERSVVPLTQRLRLETSSDAAGTLVTVYGSDMDASSAYIHLKYDDKSVHPTDTQRGATLDENVLFLGMASQAGVVDLGVTATGGASLPGGEVELAQVRFAPGAFEGSRNVSVVSGQAPTDLHFVGNDLHWTYNASGDFDQNSETNIADLTPVGVHLHHSTSDGQHDAADMVVDGDHNGEVTIAELSIIGANFLKRTTSYRVESGPAAAGPFAAVTDGSVPQSAGQLPGGGGFLQYTFSFTPTSSAFYVVRAMDGETQGQISNVVQFGAATGGAPRNLSGSDDGSKITLTWNAPLTGTPDGYDAYVSDDSGMAGAVKMNASAISPTTFDCPPIAVPVGASHYFAVVALYDGSPSNYSNIYHYGGGGAGAPANLSAVKEGSQIRLNWDPVSGADSYNAYVSDDAGMAGAVVMNLPGAITTNTFLCPAVAQADPANEHYFTVRAVVSGNESADSNIAHYTPQGGGGDTAPPQWQGGTGIKSVEPGDTFCKVYWYPAIDQTPPVQYLIAYSPEGTPIDWGNADIVDSAQSSYTIPGLTNGQRYEFAVRAQDSVAPTPNVTTNSNSLFATPMVFPPEGIVNATIASDTASVRMPGEEIPRLASVSHSGDLTYSHWDGSNWVSIDINAAKIHDPARKYHPQMIAIGDELHILFATASSVSEIYGDKDADPASWTVKQIGSGYGAVYGTGFSYDVTNNYYACVYAADSAGSDKMFYADCNVGSDWNPAQSFYTVSGSDGIWQCDFVISPFDGSQWVVAAVGTADQSGDNLEFYFGHRAARLDALSLTDSGKRGDMAVVDIDPTTTMPVVVNAEVHDVSTPGGDQPVSDATVYVWNGTTWITPPGSPIEMGDANFDTNNLTADVVLTGQDPQLVFSPSGNAVAIWSNIHTLADFSNFPDVTMDIDGSWRISTKQGTGFGAATQIKKHICSSNSVTAGEGYQHCVTCDIDEGAGDSGTFDEISAKYSTRNDYPEGDLYYFRQAWQ